MLLQPLDYLSVETIVFKAIIVEDSRLARLELKNQLKEIETIELIGEAECVEEALELCNDHLPDLILLDIDLPDGNGFDILTQLPIAPKVIFTTAFEEFALKAFDNHAVDYLLKPITLERLKQACNKLQLLSLSKESECQSEGLSLDSQFFVKDGQNCWLIQLKQVERFEAMGNYTRVYFENNKPLVYRSLAKIEQRLPGKQFFRVSRKNIVRLSAIQKVDSCASGGLELTLTDGSCVEVSRRQASLFKAMLAL